jgi:hypothetical protein
LRSFGVNTRVNDFVTAAHRKSENKEENRNFKLNFKLVRFVFF